MVSGLLLPEDPLLDQTRVAAVVGGDSTDTAPAPGVHMGPRLSSHVQAETSASPARREAPGAPPGPRALSSVRVGASPAFHPCPHMQGGREACLPRLGPSLGRVAGPWVQAPRRRTPTYGVGGGDDGAAGLQGGDDAGLGDGDALLLHGLVDAGPVLVVHLRGGPTGLLMRPLTQMKPRAPHPGPHTPPRPRAPPCQIHQ